MTRGLLRTSVSAYRPTIVSIAGKRRQLVALSKSLFCYLKAKVKVAFDTLFSIQFSSLCTVAEPDICPNATCYSNQSVLQRR